MAVDAALPPTQEIVSTPVTPANVLVELRKITAAIPSTLFGNPDTMIYVPQNIFQAYIEALGGFGSSGLGAAGVGAAGPQWYGGEGGLAIDGYNLFLAQGLASDTAIATTRDNLWYGTGLMNDANEVKVIDTSETLGDQNVRVVMRFTAGVQYGIVEDIVTYGIPNAAN